MLNEKQIEAAREKRRKLKYHTSLLIDQHDYSVIRHVDVEAVIDEMTKYRNATCHAKTWRERCLRLLSSVTVTAKKNLMKSEVLLIGKNNG
jgi:hypothetical protein